MWNESINQYQIDATVSLTTGYFRALGNDSWTLDYNTQFDNNVTDTVRGEEFVGSLTDLLIFTILIFTNVFGNTLTLLAFKRDEKLWNIQNRYVLNLCITDIALGIGALPFWASFYGTGYWYLSKWGCKIILSIDFTTTTESSFTVILLSWDRLMMLMKGATYNQIQTPRKVKIQVAVSWLIAIVLYVPAVMFYDIWSGNSIVPDNQCFPEFVYDRNFNIFVLGLQFLITVFIIIVLNVMIFYYIRKQNRSVGPASTTTNSDKNRRAMKALVLVVVTFCICWIPFSSMSIIQSVCPSCTSSLTSAFIVCLILQYSNSSLNPLLYPLASMRFRSNYKVVIFCGKVSHSAHGTTATSVA